MNKTTAMSRRLLLAGTAGVLASPPVIGRAEEAKRGVSDTEIVVGTIADLSGVTAVQGVNNANAMRLAFEEANAFGGVHGRKIHYIVEDNEYIVPKAVQAMNKLLNRDKIFFALGNGGTPHNDAVMPSMFEKNVPNVFPTTCARSMYEPFNRLKFGQFASYSTAVAEAPGEPAEGFYAMSPALFRYPNDPNPAGQAITTKFRNRIFTNMNYLGEAGYTAASFSLAALQKTGWELNLDSFIGALESMHDWHDKFGGPALSLNSTNHHASSQSFLSVIKNRRWTPVVEQPLMF